MISLAPGTKVFLACQPIDLRAGFNGLAAKAQQVIGQNPFICVAGEYVAAQFRPGQFRGDDELCRHIISCHFFLRAQDFPGAPARRESRVGFVFQVSWSAQAAS